jgi:hypothetical protein
MLKTLLFRIAYHSAAVGLAQHLQRHPLQTCVQAGRALAVSCGPAPVVRGQRQWACGRR